MSGRRDSFVCFYCGGCEPHVRSSLAHIFPAALGGTRGSRSTVCVDCNSITNREIEQEAAKRLEAFRSMWGVPNRRATTTHVDALVTGPDFAEFIRVADPSNLEAVITRRPLDVGAGQQYVVVGPSDAVERRVAEIGKMRPEVTWRGADVEVEIAVSIESLPDAPIFRRLATKIALERLADLRASAYVRRAEFRHARDFVLTGDSSTLLAGCLADPRWVGTGAPLTFRVPLHSVVLVGQPDDRVLGALVVLFGLYTYWVILSNAYEGVEPWDDLLCENPVTGERVSPLRPAGGAGHLRLPWSAWRTASVASPEEVRRNVMDAVMEKLQASADAHYGPDKEGPI